jgi:hypothetical protein
MMTPALRSALQQMIAEGPITPLTLIHFAEQHMAGADTHEAISAVLNVLDEWETQGKIKSELDKGCRTYRKA